MSQIRDITIEGFRSIKSNWLSQLECVSEIN